MTEPDWPPLRPDLESLRITLATKLAAQKQARLLRILTTTIVTICLVLLAFGLGPIVFLHLLLIIGVFGTLYWSLYRLVRHRGLSENLVIFGFTPVTVIPLLLFALTHSKTPRTTDQTVQVTALDNKGLVWSLACLGWIPFPPLMMSIIIYFAVQTLPRRLDTDGIWMRSLPFRQAKRYLWTDCQSFTAYSTEARGALTRGAFNRELSLKFSNGVLNLRTPVARDTPEYTFALRMLDRFDIKQLST